MPDSQPGNLFRVLKPVPQRVQGLQIQQIYKAGPVYGTGVEKGLGLSIGL